MRRVISEGPRGAVKAAVAKAAGCALTRVSVWVEP